MEYSEDTCTLFYFCLRGIDAPSGEATLSKWIRKGVYSLRKEFAPLGSKFFPSREDSFSEGFWCALMQTGSHKSFLPCQNLRSVSRPHKITYLVVAHWKHLSMAIPLSTNNIGLKIFKHPELSTYELLFCSHMSVIDFVCLCSGFKAQSTHLCHVEYSQFT